MATEAFGSALLDSWRVDFAHVDRGVHMSLKTFADKTKTITSISNIVITSHSGEKRYVFVIWVN